jgi:diguanylate cyclase (GGDEF)-like protein/PAS domain S-box-containing protein
MPLWIVAADDLRFLELNGAALSHYQRSEADFRMMGLDELLPIEDRGRLRRSLTLRQHDERSADLWRHVRGDGEILHVLVYCVRLDYQGVPAWLMLCMDISDWIQSEQERAVSEQRFQLVAQATSDAIWDLDLATHRLWWSDSFYETFGFKREVVGDEVVFWLDRIHPDDRLRVETSFAAFCNGEMDQWQESYRFRDQNGRYIDVHDQGKSIRSDSGRVLRVVGGMIDVSERHRYERELAWQASHDTLTGLPNRIAVTQRISAAILRAERDRSEVCVLLIDLDHFKLINDSLGHATGDEVLKVVALRLSTLFAGDAQVGRFGGDEFVAVIPHGIDRVARQQLLHLIAEPIELSGGLRYVTPSIGMACYPAHGEDADQLLKNADLAMYRAKQQGRNTCIEYDRSFETDVDDRLDVVSRLRRALDDGEFVLHFQPQFTADSRQLTGIEALVRWQHPEKGLLPPAQFIPICEESGLIIPLGRWVLREACRHHARLQQLGRGDLSIAVNVSAAQFLRGDLLEDLRALKAEFALPPGAIELELTESVVMESPEVVILVMQELRDLGVSMSLDDFGTGYSSLAYLKRLPLDRLKIDRAFVRDLPQDEDDAAICTSVIALASALRLRVVAEGVEMPEQLDWLADHGCDEVQGYLLARPLPFEEWLASLGFVRNQS